VAGTRALLDASLRAGCHRLVLVSTLAVYDVRRPGMTLDEQAATLLAPGDPYAFTKAEAERLALAAGGPELSVVVLRPGAILAMDARSAWGPPVLELARAGAAGILPTPELHHVHVDHVLDAIDLSLRAPAGLVGAYNVVDAAADVGDYLRVLYDALRRPVPPFAAKAPGLRFPVEKIRRDIGWTPRDRWAEFVEQMRACFADVRLP
jgi:nucleoside-diphosphate-sugar epimerase